MSLNRFLEQVAKNLAKNAEHGASDAAALNNLRKGPLGDAYSIVGTLKPADVLRKEASIRAEMTQVFLREDIPADQRKRFMDAMLDTAKNPPPEPPPVASTRTARAEGGGDSSILIDPRTNQPFTSTGGNGNRVPPNQETRAQAAPEPPRGGGSGSGRPPGGGDEPPRANGLTGNQAADNDLVGTRTARENFRIEGEKYWQTRAGDLNRITGYLRNASNDPREAAKVLKELDDKYSGIVNNLPYNGPKPIDAQDVINKLQTDKKVYANGRDTPNPGELPAGGVGITREEYNAVRAYVHEPLIPKMADELMLAKWKNAYSADDFATFERALKETGRYENGANPNGNRSVQAALADVAGGGKIYGAEFNKMKLDSPKSGLTDAQLKSTDEVKLGHRVIDGIGSAVAAIPRFFNAPRRWDGASSGSFTGRIATTVGALGIAIVQPFVDLVPDNKDYTGINTVQYHVRKAYGYFSEDYQQKVIDKFNTGKADAMTADLARSFIEKKREATTEAASAEAQSKDLLEKKVAEDRVGAVQMAGRSDADDYIASRRNGSRAPAGVPLVEADAAVGELNQLSMVNIKQMTDLAALIADKGKKGDPNVLSAAEYAEVKMDPRFTKGVPEPAQKKLDELLAPKLAP